MLLSVSNHHQFNHQILVYKFAQIIDIALVLPKKHHKGWKVELVKFKEAYLIIDSNTPNYENCSVNQHYICYKINILYNPCMLRRPETLEPHLVSPFDLKLGFPSF